MSKETNTYLQNNIICGFTDIRGEAWWKGTGGFNDQGETNHFPGAIPVEEAVRRLFNWQAIEVPVYVAVPDGDDGIAYKFVETHKGIARSDTYELMGIHSDTFGLDGHQYDEWLISKATALGLPLANCGLLKGGAVAFAQFSIAELRKTASGITFMPNLLVASSWNGTLASTAKDCCTNTICDNTMAMGLAEASQLKLSVKHTRHSASAIEEAGEALAYVLGLAEQFENEVERLCAVTVTDDQFRKVLDVIVPLPEDGNKRGTTVATDKRNILMGLYKYDVRCEPWQGTGYGVVQTFNTFAHHKAQVRGGVDRGARNMENVLSGKFAKLDRQVVETVDALCVN